MEIKQTSLKPVLTVGNSLDINLAIAIAIATSIE